MKAIALRVLLWVTLADVWWSAFRFFRPLQASFTIALVLSWLVVCAFLYARANLSTAGDVVARSVTRSGYPRSAA